MTNIGFDDDGSYKLDQYALSKSTVFSFLVKLFILTKNFHGFYPFWIPGKMKLILVVPHS
jgi:hypothetical protein